MCMYFVHNMIYSTIWHWLSIMVSTVSKDDVVVHKTYCFDFDLSLTFWKVTKTCGTGPLVEIELATFWLRGTTTAMSSPDEEIILPWTLD